MCGVRANVSPHTDDDPSGFRETNVSNPSFDRFPQNRFYIGIYGIIIIIAVFGGRDARR